MATKTWVWTGTTSLFSNGANLTGTMNVNKGTTPSDFAADQVVSVRFEIAIAGSSFSDDTWNADRDYRIATAATGSIGAAVNGTNQTLLGNTTDSTDLTDNSPNTGLTVANWEAMEVYGGDLDTENLWAVYVVNMMTDSALLWLNGPAGAVTITITYNLPVLITHATDARVGTFVDHTTDAILFEFDRPEATQPYATGLWSQGTKTIVHDGVVWMVGVGTGSEPDTVRLWEGVGGAGIGNWVLHEFTHGSGTSMLIRDVVIAAIGDLIHIVYLHHNYGGGGAIRLYHIYWDTVTKDFTDNGVFGTGESSTTSTVSNAATCDLMATADGELVATSNMYVYTSFGPDNRYRQRMFVYRSTNESFTGVTAYLYHTHWGADIFNKSSPFPVRIEPGGNDVYLGSLHLSRFDSAEVEHGRYSGLPDESASVWYETGGAEASGNRLYHDGRLYRAYQRNNIEDVIAGLISAPTGTDVLVFDDSRMILGPQENNPKYENVFVDHYGHVGIFIYTDDDQNGLIYLWNGIDAFNLAEDFPFTHTTEPHNYYIANEIVDRQFSAWAYNASGDWTWVGVDIGTWFVAHTTDAVLSDGGDGQVYHTTDAILVRGPYGLPYIDNGQNGDMWSLVASGSKFYTVLLDGPTVVIFESDHPLEPGLVITEWEVLPSTDAWVRSLDFIEVSGVLHFLLMVNDNQRWEAHHSEYNISTDTWTHNGSFHNASPNNDYLAHGHVAISVRADGDLMAFYLFDINNYYYSINTGTGFPTGTSMSFSSGSRTAVAVDNNDTHFIARQGTTLHHWRLSPTDVLGTRQQVATMLEAGGEINGIVHSLVYSNVMYVATASWSGAFAEHQFLYVADAATGSDAPSWTKTQVTTKEIAGSGGRLFCWFVYGLNGVPTFIYAEQITWKIYKTHLDAGSWIEVDTGLVLDVADGEIFLADGDDTLNFGARYALDTVDSDNHFTGWYQRRLRVDGTDLADNMWRQFEVNLNPTVFHTTDAVLIVPASQTVAVGTLAETDALQPIGVPLIKAIGTLAETDDMVAISPVTGGDQSIAVSALAETDTPLPVAKPVIQAVGTLAEVDAPQPIAAQHVITVSPLAETETLIPIGITLSGDTDIIVQVTLTDDITPGVVQPAIGLGIVGRAGGGTGGRTGGSSSDHAQKIYHPDRRIVRK